MLKNENSIEWAERVDKNEEGTPFLEDEEFDEMLRSMLGKGRWKGIVNRWREKGYSEFKIGYTVGELKQKIDKDYIHVD